MNKYDPITLEIIQSSLQAAADEMFAALRRTAMSAIIYEVLDMGTGITDRYGELAGSGAGIPAFVGVLDKTVKRVISGRIRSCIGRVASSSAPSRHTLTQSALLSAT